MFSRNMKYRIRHWLIPQGWYNLYKSFSSGTKEVADKSYQKVTDIEKLSLLKDIHKDERCFILASGPSIKDEDLTPLKNEHCIAVSQFFLHPQISDIRPAYHCFAPQHSPFNNDTNKIIFDNYVKYYTFPVKAFIGTTNYEYSYYNFLKDNQHYNMVDSYFIDYTGNHDLNEQNYQSPELWDPTQQPFNVWTVVYEAIMMAYYMGFKEIYLLGVDHDYLKDTNRTTNHHFYEEKDSFNDQKHLEEISKEKWFFIYYSRWKHYRLMKEFLNSQGIAIYNATQGSMLDVFPTVSLDSVLNR